MVAPTRKTTLGIAALLLVVGVAKAAESAACLDAKAAYAELVSRAVMEPAQYPLTAEGGAVRAACGRDALPAPAGADINPVRPHRHKQSVGASGRSGPAAATGVAGARGMAR